MTNDRVLQWDGCGNVRDLGGLPTRDGRLTSWGAVVRGDHPARLSAVGWSALQAHGIRTIVSLHSHGYEENVPDTAPRPSDLTTVCVEIEDFTDSEFMQKWAYNDLLSTPLYYRDVLERWPQFYADTLAVIARARLGGVLFHCRRGVDRTGIIAILLLAVAGVTPEAILADYELSVDPEREVLLARENTTTPQVIRTLLDWLDIDAYLLSGGMSPQDLAALRARLLEPPGVVSS